MLIVILVLLFTALLAAAFVLLAETDKLRAAEEGDWIAYIEADRHELFWSWLAVVSMGSVFVICLVGALL